MSRRVVAVAVLLAVAGAVLCTSCQSKAPAMTDGPGVLYLYSPVWPICQGMEPIVDRLEETYGDEFNFVRINVDTAAGKDVAREYGLIGQPYYLFFDSANEETRRMSGPHPFDVLAQEIERTMQE